MAECLQTVEDTILTSLGEHQTTESLSETRTHPRTRTMTQRHARLLFALSLGTAIPVLCLAIAARQPAAQPTQEEAPQAEAADEGPTDEALFDDMVDNHWARIFPNGDRNVGGPQFFKYIYERLATSHDLFKRYTRFYCGVSGAVVRPTEGEWYELVKVKDNEGLCVVGKYYRCCWPCACDVMKHARVERATFRLPNDPSGQEETYWVLTIGDPCHRCASSPCPDLPPEVTIYDCKDNVTANGLRVSEGRLTSGKAGRLVFALLHDAIPADQTDEDVTEDLLTRCLPRINATPEELEEMGGMGNLFVSVALINSDETITNTLEDLCD